MQAFQQHDERSDPSARDLRAAGQGVELGISY